MNVHVSCKYDLVDVRRQAIQTIRELDENVGSYATRAAEHDDETGLPARRDAGVDTFER